MLKLTPYFDAYFNPLILDGFFMGFYFLLYAQAVWKLVKKKAIGPYLFALIVLWMSLTSFFIFDWVRARNAFVINNDSPGTIFKAYNEFSNNTPFIAILVASTVSDAMLIWRCYIYWGKRWALWVLIPLMFASSVCNISFIAVPDKSEVEKLLRALASILSAVTTIIATCMIAAKVITTTGNGRGGNPYPKAIEIFVQSAALQSTVLLIDAMVSLVISIKQPEFGSQSDAILTQISAYTFTCSRAAMGISPTLIGFRVADEKPQTEANNANQTSVLSRLTFRRSARRTDTESRAERTHISTIRFGTVHRENDDELGLDDEFGRRESDEKAQPITAMESKTG